jgi:hypothetical protein
MKQTAVEQFIEQLEKQGDSWENVSMGTINISIKVEDYLQLKKQAKEMENEQMINYHTHLIEKFTKLEYTFNTDVKLILENYKTTKQ